MLKKLGQFFAVGAMLCGLVLFQGCGGDDITAPDAPLDDTGSPAGSEGMAEDHADHDHDHGDEGHSEEGAAEAPAEGGAEAPAEEAAEAPAEGEGN